MLFYSAFLTPFNVILPMYSTFFAVLQLLKIVSFQYITIFFYYHLLYIINNLFSFAKIYNKIFFTNKYIYPIKRRKAYKIYSFFSMGFIFSAHASKNSKILFNTAFYIKNNSCSLRKWCKLAPALFLCCYFIGKLGLGGVSKPKMIG